MKYLTQFFALESIAIMVITLISFLFGLLIGYLRWGSKLSTARKQIREKDQFIATLEGETNRLKEELALKDADFQKATFELEEWDKNMKRLEQEKSQIRAELYTAKDVIKELKASNQTYSSTVEDLNLQVMKLQSQNEELALAIDDVEAPTNDLAALQSTYNATNTRLAAFEEKLMQLEVENNALKSMMGNLNSGEIVSSDTNINHADQLARIEARLEELTAENHWLKTELEHIKDHKVSEGQHEHESFTAHTDTVNIEPLPVSPDKLIYGDKINVDGVGRPKDDLTKIEGIGPFIEKKLNDIGITTYEQIAAFDNAKIQEVTKAIQFLPGRIEKDNWVGQASNLLFLDKEPADEDPNNLEVYAVSTGAPVSLMAVEEVDNSTIAVPPMDASNLQVVEGVGPKIEEKLKEAGIANLHDLSNTSKERLQEILENAGTNYRIHDPSTWPDQAKLAVAGDWAKLKTYQDYLIGGRDPETI